MDDDLKKLLEENLRLNKENYLMLRKIKRHFFWQSIIGWFYFIIIVGPIVWSIFYLPAILKPVISQYQDLLGGASAAGSLNLQDVQKSITPEMLDKLKSDK
jgi:hypothetical protein